MVVNNVKKDLLSSATRVGAGAGVGAAAATAPGACALSETLEIQQNFTIPRTYLELKNLIVYNLKVDV